ncbi:MAG TPA: acetyl-CoA carboxylase carboxyl transferase subunit alpha, partial [Bacteroidota bacterium]|nr:acetyl-CoA carboxylase carboxyl transferase subunit alpha [Bacteroidota bacterium]
KEQAAEALKLTAPDLLSQKIIDRIVPEPLGGAHRNPQQAADSLKEALIDELKKLKKIKPDKLISRRVEKFAAMGAYEE